MKKIEIDSFLNFQYVSNPSFSPDGAHIAFITSKADREENTYKADIYVYSLSSGKVTRLTAGGDAKSYAWTEKNTLLFTADREKAKKEENNAPETHFYEISPEGGEAQKVFSVPAKVTGFRALTGNTLLLTVKHDNYSEIRKSTYEVFDEIPFWGNGMGYTNAMRNRLAVYDSESGELTYLADEWTECASPSVYGDLILYKAYPWKQNVCGIDYGVYLYNRKTKTTETMIEPEEMRCGTIELLNEDEAIIATNGKGVKDYSKYCDFYKLNLHDKSLSLFVPYDASIGGNSVGSDARYGSGRTQKAVDGDFYFVSTVGNSAHLYKLSKDGTISDALTGSNSCDSFDLSNGRLVSCEMRGQGLSELYLDGKQITHMNDSFESEYAVVKPEPLSFTATDGYEIHGWVMKPADYKEGVSYPAILHIHGGPRTAFSDVYHHEMQVWANAGYFVFFCNPRGSDGRGADFGDIKGKYGTIEYVNLMEFTDLVLKNYPQIDPARVGVAGGSYGGFMTNWIVGHTDRFAVAVSQRSIANWVSFEHNSDIGHFFTPHEQGSITREDPALLWEQSPLKYAPNCKTPILFIHSDQDYRCYMAEGLAMFSAVKRNGCPAKLCLFHGENHELSRSGKPENRIDRMKEIVDWMDLYLK